jgi:hypothetical protein
MQKYNDPYEPLHTGRALTEFSSEDPSNWRNWILKPVANTSGAIFKIFNAGLKGYLNARFRLEDSPYREVFVESVGDQDNWRIKEYDTLEFSFQNVKTGEYLYAMLDRNQETPGRTTFTWDYSKEKIDDAAIWIIRKDCNTDNPLSKYFNKRVCFEIFAGGFLYPSPNYHQKYADLQESRFTGRAFIAELSNSPPHWGNWSIIPISVQNSTCKIFNHGTGGYLNARSILIDSDRRDVFVERDSDGDQWKFYWQFENTYALQHVRTGEYLHASFEDNQKFKYEGESGRIIYTWNHEVVTRAAHWYIKTNCTSF